jgi:hypothetical protein
VEDNWITKKDLVIVFAFVKKKAFDFDLALDLVYIL